MIRVLMFPTLADMRAEESGIKRVIENYYKHAEQTGVEYVKAEIEDYDAYDVMAIHAGTSKYIPDRKPLVSILHGLYWTADYSAHAWEWNVNSRIVATLRCSTVVTVPSYWVSETFKRDMRISPYIVPHGIDWENWQDKVDNNGHILWNKNRNVDVCDPKYLGVLADAYPELEFISTFKPDNRERKNIREVGVIPHKDMKPLIMGAGVYLSTTKETFGIGVLEAMASGVPVLGFNHGGNKELIKHGVDGYLAQPDNKEDLIAGLKYCFEYRDILSANARHNAKAWTWESATEKIARVYHDAQDYYNKMQRLSKIDNNVYMVKK